LGVYYYFGFLNYTEALKQFDLVLNVNPKDPEALYYSACVHRRAGNWNMAKSDFEEAVHLDPGRVDYAQDAGETFDLVREYSKAEKFYEMPIRLQPDWQLAYSNLSNMYLRLKGDTIKAIEVLVNEKRYNKSFVSDSLSIETEILINIYEGKYEQALKVLSNYRYEAIQTQFYIRPKSLYYANIYGLMKKPEIEHAYYDSARVFYEKKIISNPEDQRLYASLGILYAGLGQADRAISSGEKAVTLMPVSKEAWRGVFFAEELARIYVMTGKYDQAVRQIKYVLSIPGYLSPEILELDPIWAPLRNHPAFKKIMESYSRE
jgi:tetratricopeptide (TPR) repeat protein